MKIKKLAAVLFTSVLLLTASQSAFADSTLQEVSPMAIGIGDTQQSAISLIPDGEFSLFTSNSTEKDWFKWTNNTGAPKKVTGQLLSLENNPNANRLGFLVDYNDTSTPTTILYSEYGKVGARQSVANVYLPPGATVYAIVDTVNFVSIGQYELLFYAY